MALTTRTPMRTKRSIKWGLVIAAATVAVAAMPGCELLVDFDRSKIPEEGGPDGTTEQDSPSGDVINAMDSSSSGDDSSMPGDSSGGGDSTGDSPAEGATESGSDS